MKTTQTNQTASAPETRKLTRSQCFSEIYGTKRTIPAEKPTAIETEQPYIERNYGRELNQLAARAERAEALAAQLAEALRECLKCHSSNAPIHAVITQALAAYESEVRQ